MLVKLLLAGQTIAFGKSKVTYKKLRCFTK